MLAYKDMVSNLSQVTELVMEPEFGHCFQQPRVGGGLVVTDASEIYW